MYKLSRKHERILRTILPILIPSSEDFTIEEIEPVVMIEAQAMLRDYPTLFRIAFLSGISLFNWLPLFFGYGASRFVYLSFQNQCRYLAQWAESSFHPFRFFFNMTKIFLMLISYSQPQLWRGLNYTPEQHMGERIALHQQVMMRSAKESHPL